MTHNDCAPDCPCRTCPDCGYAWWLHRDGRCPMFDQAIDEEGITVALFTDDEGKT